MSEGIETANFLKSLGWGKRGSGSADYVDDTQVIRLRRPNGTAYFFMPFGLDRPALVISGTARAWRVNWNSTLRSQANSELRREVTAVRRDRRAVVTVSLKRPSEALRDPTPGGKFRMGIGRA